MLPRQRKLWAELGPPAQLEQKLQAMMRSTKGRKALKALVRGGVPCELRGRVRRARAGASAARAALDDDGYYDRLLSDVKRREAAATPVIEC